MNDTGPDPLTPRGAKACGCGPLEPCKPHREAGDLTDWEGRARAAEAKLAAGRRAFHGTLIRFAAEAVRGKHACGLAEEPAFEALRRIGVELKKAADEMAAASIREDRASPSGMQDPAPVVRVIICQPEENGHG